jgi:LacI family gluconate utilization system Gnt-I transcriptional repressor
MSQSSEPPAGRNVVPPSQETIGAEGATLDDVARLVGVHPATVSRAINRPDMVSPKTLERVRAAIEQIGYVPNLLAGGLASNRSRLVAAIVPSIGTAMFAEAVETLTDRLREAGYEVLLGLTGFHRPREDELVSAVLGRRPDAVVLTGIDHSARARRQLLTARIPVVECWDLTPSPIDIVVGFSHEKAGRAAALHLLARGHDDVGVIAASDTRALRRRDGFVEALAERGVTPRTVHVTDTPGSHRLGREALATLAGAGRLPRALFCTSDPLAQGAVTEAQVRGLRVPDDIAIMGFGDFPDSATSAPSLTSIFFDRRRIGLTAATAILQELQGEPLAERVIDIGFRIAERESA